MRCLAPLLLVITVCHAKINVTSFHRRYSDRLSDIDGTSKARIVGDTGGLMYSNYKWISVLYDYNNDNPVSHAVFYNQYWVIANGRALAPYEGATLGLYLEYNFNDLSDLSTSDMRMINQVVVHENQVDSLNDIALARVCPKIASPYAPLPSAPISYLAGQETTLLGYDTDLSSAKKNVGERCECQDYYPNEYDPVLDICLQEHPDIYSDSDDIPGVVVIRNNQVVGMITVKQNPSAGGEIAIDFSEYLQWLRDNAVYP